MAMNARTTKSSSKSLVRKILNSDFYGWEFGDKAEWARILFSRGVFNVIHFVDHSSGTMSKLCQCKIADLAFVVSESEWRRYQWALPPGSVPARAVAPEWESLPFSFQTDYLTQ